MSPLPKHGRDVHLVASIITTLLQYFNHDYEAFTPITLTVANQSAIEPEYCFYITNWAAVAGKERLNWEKDPPPDLVVEVDVTSYSSIEDYLPYRIPEIWILRQGNLFIYWLEEGTYISHNQSQDFPGLNLPELVAHCLKIAYEENSSAAIRELKQRLKNT
jgi:Uma2 family endonuclease